MCDIVLINKILFCGFEQNLQESRRMKTSARNLLSTRRVFYFVRSLSAKGVLQQHYAKDKFGVLFWKHEGECFTDDDHFVLRIPFEVSWIREQTENHVV